MRAKSILLLTLATIVLVAASAEPAWSAPTPAPAKGLSKATFAGCCFWCVESYFDKVPGVISMTSGYTGGKVDKPTYEQVSGKHSVRGLRVPFCHTPCASTRQPHQHDSKEKLRCNPTSFTFSFHPACGATSAATRRSSTASFPSPAR